MTSFLEQPDNPAAWIGLCKAVFFLLCVVYLWKAVRKTETGRRTGRTRSRAYRMLFAVFCVLFGAVLVYQATWQLAGFARPDFVAFMERYDKRPVNPARDVQRGRITDRRGVPLAVDRNDPLRPRAYPEGPVFAHVTGYLDERYGRTGLEEADHAYLSGYGFESGDSWKQFGRNMFDRKEIRGSDLVLTLDAGLQRIAYELMKERTGAVVMLDPRNGAVLVMVSTPSFDPNNLQPALFRADPDRAPLLNRALQGLYPPGSTVKPLVAAIALGRNLRPVYDCPAAGITAGTGNQPIRDHEYYQYRKDGKVWPGHGRLDMREALQKSSNVYFARLGLDLGGAALTGRLETMGLNGRWTVFRGSSGEIRTSAGSVPPLNDDDKARTAQVAIGQGALVVTPMHMALLAGAIGRGGAAWRPRLAEREPPEPLNPLMPAEAARTLTGMMRDAVHRGTGIGADIPGLRVAGKTGTAQTPRGDDHSWFICFAPAEDPVIAMAVIVEHGGYGSRSAVPVTAELLRAAEKAGYFRAASEGQP